MPPITIYSTPTCVYCKKAEAFFKSKNLAYTKIDVVEDEKARDEMIKKSGQFGVPVITIGETTLVGFNEREVEEVLKSAPLTR